MFVFVYVCLVKTDMFDYACVMFVPGGRGSEKGGGSPPQTIVVKVLLRREAHRCVVKDLSPVVS